ncbi:transmembrane channel-like protein 5 [Puntigrus tetrazona]|uniref:transmembrane channel-like protein 5 n=1 Tax=Puntigrus tetrazona TaxID=1606681 RepID=UPI001C893EA5|nr:transmembrane channel-like protein 5 [Puntigrus tetrazona]
MAPQGLLGSCLFLLVSLHMLQEARDGWDPPESGSVAHFRALLYLTYTSELVSDLVNLSATARFQAIRSLPKPFYEKKTIRDRVNSVKLSKAILAPDCRQHVSRSFRRFRASLASARQHLIIWQDTLKEIGGRFGTSVLSYFLFLKWLLKFNLFSLIINFCFITIPQIVHAPNISSITGFRGLELLTGVGYFNQTVLFYGGYDGEVIASKPAYNMQLAYFFTVAAYLVLCGVSLIYSMSRSFQNNFVLETGPVSEGAWRLLCSWDFSVVNEKAIQYNKNNLAIQLKESLSERLQVKNKTSLPDRIKHLSLHLLAWLLSLGLALGSGAGIYFLGTKQELAFGFSQDPSDLGSEASTLLLPVVVSLINLIVPLFYSLIDKIESYSNPRAKIYISIVRSVILKMSILGILCFYWLHVVPDSISCWESFVGQSVYRLLIIDFIFCLLGIFFGEFLRYFSHSLLYYGYYSNKKLHTGCNGTSCSSELSYNMPLAYFFTIGAAFFITCIILVYSMSKSFGQSFRIDKSKGLLAIKVFSSWDFKVIKKSSVKLQRANIGTQLKKNTIYVYHIKMFLYGGLKCILTVSVCTCLFPRNLLLKVSVLGVLCYHWLYRVASYPESLGLQCWESFVGQELYRFLLMDFIFMLLDTFFGEFLWSVIGTMCIQSLGVPEFDIARNVLDLIYAQTLAWIGIYFSPLLPVMQVLKLFIIFYLKKISLSMNCQPPKHTGRAAQIQTVFIALLFFPSFVGALTMVAFTVWSLKPSDQCGPFQGLDTPFRTIFNWTASLPENHWVWWIFENILRSELFYYLISLIVLVFTYFLWQITQGRKQLIKSLREQIVNEGKDKAFLLNKLQTLQKERRETASYRPQNFDQTPHFNPNWMSTLPLDM